MEKKLLRSTSNKWIAGICGGIAEYFGWSADVLRMDCVDSDNNLLRWYCLCCTLADYA